jgi:hypothetical protein
MSEQSILKRRTASERLAYIQGLEAGINMVERTDDLTLVHALQIAKAQLELIKQDLVLKQIKKEDA